MITMVMDCPHCSAQHVGFDTKISFRVPGKLYAWAIPATCNACTKGVMAIVDVKSLPSTQPPKPSDAHGNIVGSSSKYYLVDVYPRPALDDAPAGTPPAVQTAFKQASASRRAGHFDAASSMYRKAMELGLKALSPDIEAWKIEKRIDKMAAEHRITPELQTWAHELRLDGNDAVHSDTEATEEMVSQMHELCKFLLIYLYSLPAQVAAAKQRRAGAG